MGFADQARSPAAELGADARAVVWKASPLVAFGHG